jgi:16S rRNA (uracil1498-N3)-methyltransferase
MGYFIFDTLTNSLKEDEIHHIKDVLRLKPNTLIQAIDGIGNLYDLKINSLKPFYTEILEQKIIPRDKIYTRCIIASIKTPLLELIIQKLTEIGIDEIIITKTNFSQINLDKLENKLQRWQNIAVTACKQSERVYFPKISLQNLDKIEYSDTEIRLIGDTQYTTNAKYILHIDYNNIEQISLLIGPEGGFESKEYNNLIEQERYIPIKFASNILRSETAAIVGAGIIKTIQL